eukprot:4105189-Pyramimonas_sp.AAC.1
MAKALPSPRSKLLPVPRRLLEETPRHSGDCDAVRDLLVGSVEVTDPAVEPRDGVAWPRARSSQSLPLGE